MIGFAVEVEDKREQEDPRELCANDALFRFGSLRSRRDPAEIVREAIVREFESHDLRVEERPKSQLVIHTELLQFTCWTAAASGGPIARKGARALIETKISVRDTATGEEYYWFNPRHEGEYRDLSFLYTADPYRSAFENALDRFARRLVQRPQILLAAQRVAAGMRRKNQAPLERDDRP